MKIAIIGSRTLTPDIAAHLPAGVTQIISGGAKGVDALAEEYADRHGIPKRIFLPQYERYGRAAPLKRNEQMVDAADRVLAFWDGRSRGTRYTLEYARKQGKPVTLIPCIEINISSK